MSSGFGVAESQFGIIRLDRLLGKHYRHAIAVVIKIFSYLEKSENFFRPKVQLLVNVTGSGAYYAEKCFYGSELLDESGWFLHKHSGKVDKFESGSSNFNIISIVLSVSSISGVAVLRYESSILFNNVNHFRSKVQEVANGIKG